jgi:hypothetical protein
MTIVPSASWPGRDMLLRAYRATVIEPGGMLPGIGVKTYVCVCVDSDSCPDGEVDQQKEKAGTTTDNDKDNDNDPYR